MSNKIAIAIEIDARNIPNFEKNIPTLRSSVRKSLKNRNLPIGGINFSIDENGMVVVECYNGFANFKNQQLRNIRNIPKESALSWEQHAKKYMNDFKISPHFYQVLNHTFSTKNKLKQSWNICFNQ